MSEKDKTIPQVYYDADTVLAVLVTRTVMQKNIKYYYI